LACKTEKPAKPKFILSPNNLKANHSFFLVFNTTDRKYRIESKITIIFEKDLESISFNLYSLISIANAMKNSILKVI
jgi:hypothetical protein